MFSRAETLGFLSLSLALAACGREPGAGAGVTLFDRLAGARLESYPETSLPPEIAALAIERAPMRSLEIVGDEWIYAGIAPDRFRSRLPPGAKATFYRASPRIHRAPGSAPPRPVRDGRPLAAWDPERDPYPGEAFWWDEGERTLFALAASMPEGVRVEYEADAGAEFGTLEMRLPGPGEATDRRGSRPPPEPRDLVRQIQIGPASRRCLLLPAPGAITVPLGRLEADGIRLAIGVVGRAWRLAEGRVEATSEGSDGVEFSLEVLEGDRAERVSRAFLSADHAGEEFVETSVDLRPFRGREIALRLATGPGPSGNAWFDYAVWGDLRLTGGEPRASGRPHVILVDLDTLRADRLGCYGYDRPTSPRIDAWAAANAVVHLDAWAASSWTLPSTISMRTGLAVRQHRAFTLPSAMPAEASTLATHLRSAGYATYGLTEGAILVPALGFDRGFDHYVVTGGGAPDWRFLLEKIGDWKGEGPFYLFLNTYATHAPYPPDERFEDPERPYAGWLAERDIDYEGVIEPYLRGDLELGPEEREHISRRYDAGVAAMDALVGPFLEGLEELLHDQEFLLVLTSDHGEELFDHERLGHGHSLYGELLRVPLVVRYPGEAGRRRAGSREEPAWSLDIVPTVLDVARLPVPDLLPGVSLRGALPRTRARVARTHEQTAIQLDRFKLVLGALHSPRWTAEPEELYDVLEDPRERRNLAPERPEIVRRLRESLQRFEEKVVPLAEGDGEIGALSPEEWRRLRELGYVDRGR